MKSPFKQVTIAVKCNFGEVPVTFKVIDVINEHNRVYALLAQNRVVIGQYLPNDTWKLSESVDLTKLQLVECVIHDTLSEFEKELNYLDNPYDPA